jgi:hypothetical protein
MVQAKVLFICILISCAYALGHDHKASKNVTKVEPEVELDQQLQNLRVVLEQGNVQVTVNNPVHMEFQEMIVANEGGVEFTVAWVPPGLEWDINGTLFGTVSEPGQYKMVIKGKVGDDEEALPSWWLLVSDENGVVPSYVPEGSLSPLPTPSNSKTASRTSSFSITPTISASVTPITMLMRQEAVAMHPIRVVVAMSNYATLLDDFVSLDLSDTLETPKYPVFFEADPDSIPAGLKIDRSSGVISGKPSMLGKWRVNVSCVAEENHLVKADVPPFFIIVTDQEGDYDQPMMNPNVEDLHASLAESGATEYMKLF